MGIPYANARREMLQTSLPEYTTKPNPHATKETLLPHRLLHLCPLSPPSPSLDSDQTELIPSLPRAPRPSSAATTSSPGTSCTSLNGLLGIAPTGPPPPEGTISPGDFGQNPGDRGWLLATEFRFERVNVEKKLLRMLPPLPLAPIPALSVPSARGFSLSG